MLVGWVLPNVRPMRIACYDFRAVLPARSGKSHWAIPMDKNTLDFGDNLPILRERMAAESVDPAYLDPPFNSDANFNVLFAEHDGSQADSQVKAFQDTWHWDQTAARAYEDFVVTPPHQASQALQAFRTLLGCNDMLAYLSMMNVVTVHRPPISGQEWALAEIRRM
jgi:hypothetical protein